MVKKSNKSRLTLVGPNLFRIWAAYVLLLILSAFVKSLFIMALAWLAAILFCYYALKDLFTLNADNAALKEQNHAIEDLIVFKDKYNNLLSEYTESVKHHTLRSHEVFQYHHKLIDNSKADKGSIKTTTDEAFWEAKQCSLQKESERGEEVVNDQVSGVEEKCLALQSEIRDIFDRIEKSNYDAQLIKEMLPELEQKSDNLKTTITSLVQDKEDVIQGIEKAILSSGV